MRRRSLPQFPLLPAVPALIVFTLLFSCATTEPAAGTAAPGENAAVTRYPVILVHGLGWRDDVAIAAYWGSVPGYLESLGVRVFLCGHDSYGTIETNARLLANRIAEVKERTGSAKVNIIAHSKGGLESRYAISSLGMGPHVASLTTLATPHRGTYTAEYFLKQLAFVSTPVSEAANLLGRALGDEAPDLLQAGKQLTRESMAAFNRENPDFPGIYYQSYAAAVDEGYPALAIRTLYRILAAEQGANDGLVPVTSARWGEFRGIISGVSHADITGSTGYDIEGLYSRIVGDLAAQGY